jgi:hypothetical protein
MYHKAHTVADNHWTRLWGYLAHLVATTMVMLRPDSSYNFAQSGLLELLAMTAGVACYALIGAKIHVLTYTFSMAVNSWYRWKNPQSRRKRMHPRVGKDATRDDLVTTAEWIGQDKSVWMQWDRF